MDTHTVGPALGASLGWAAAQDIQPLACCGSKELHLLLSRAPGTGEGPQGGEGICVLSYLAVLRAGTQC